MNVPAERLRQQVATILTAWGLAPAAVATTAEVMVQTDLAGVDSHGVAVLTMYEDLRGQGHLNFSAVPRVVRDNPATASIDADNGLGHAVGVMAMELAMSKARTCGVGMVTVFNSAHYGAAGYYSNLAAKQGLIGVAMTTTRMYGVVPTRSRAGALGTNPIALAAPARRNPAFSLDMSTSTTAVNKVRVYAMREKPLPEGWILDEKGEAVTDPKAAMSTFSKQGQGGLTPLGGVPVMASHKGYGLGMVVQILAGTLAGASFSPLREQNQGKHDPDNIGHFCLAIDPKAFLGEGRFEDDLDAALDYLRALPAINPAEPVLVPGDPEWASIEERSRDGIPMQDALIDQIESICKRAGAKFILREDPPARDVQAHRGDALHPL